MGDKKLFTIVVPIYNVERYLKQCLDSLLYQTLINHEVVMINDGSTDDSGAIAREYAEKYPHIFRYYEQKNAGLGAARNVGFKYVTTEMVGFLDSDDWVPKTYIERLTDRVDRAGVLPDLLYTLPLVFDSATSRFADWMDKPIYDKVFSNDYDTVCPKIKPEIMALEPNANRKLYRTEFLLRHNISFPENTKWEDVEPHFELLHLADTCIAAKNTGFIYRVNSGSQITASVGPDRLQVVSVFARALKKANSENWPQIEKSYILRMMYSFAKWSISLTTNAVRKDLVIQLHELYKSVKRKTLKRYFSDLHVRKKTKLYICILKSNLYVLLICPVKYNRLRSFLGKIISFRKRKMKVGL